MLNIVCNKFFESGVVNDCSLIDDSDFDFNFLNVNFFLGNAWANISLIVSFSEVSVNNDLDIFLC
jgi:hypothetical protein